MSVLCLSVFPSGNIFIYKTMACPDTFRQLGMKGERDSISVIGNIPQKKWLIERMRTYVGEVSAPDAKETGLPEQLRFPSIPYDMQVLISQISQ